MCVGTGVCPVDRQGSIWLEEDVGFEEPEAFVTILMEVAQDSTLGGLRPTRLSPISYL